jgi:hypothetical protein
VRYRKIAGVAAALAVTAAWGLGTSLGFAKGFAEEVADAQPKMIGGHEATGNTDWMVSVQYDAPNHDRFDWLTCGGTLAVARDIVLTNAHCVTDLVTDPPAPSVDVTALGKDWRMDAQSLIIPTKDKQFKVRIGSKDWTSGGELVPVKSITVHPNWNWAIGSPQAEAADLAVLRLDHPVDYQPMQLAGTPGRPGQNVVLYGWGIDHPDSATEPLPRRLQQLETTVIAPARCAPAALSAKDICVDSPHGTDGVCFGDSGGPAVRYTAAGVPQLVGGVSRTWGDYCATKPTVFTSQPEYRTWIYDVIRSSAPPIGSNKSGRWT